MPKSTKRRELHFESETQYLELRSTIVRLEHADEREHVAFLFASPTKNGEMDIVDVAMLEAPDFIEQSSHYLELRDAALQKMIIHAHRTGTALVEAHSHPLMEGPRVRFSSFDCEELANIGPQMSWRLPGRPYIALVFGRNAFDSLYWESRERRPHGCVDLVVAGKLLRASRESYRFWERCYG